MIAGLPFGGAAAAAGGAVPPGLAAGTASSATDDAVRQFAAWLDGALPIVPEAETAATFGRRVGREAAGEPGPAVGAAEHDDTRVDVLDAALSNPLFTRPSAVPPTAVADAMPATTAAIDVDVDGIAVSVPAPAASAATIVPATDATVQTPLTPVTAGIETLAVPATDEIADAVTPGTGSATGDRQPLSAAVDTPTPTTAGRTTGDAEPAPRPTPNPGVESRPGGSDDTEARRLVAAVRATGRSTPRDERRGGGVVHQDATGFTAGAATAADAVPASLAGSPSSSAEVRATLSPVAGRGVVNAAAVLAQIAASAQGAERAAAPAVEANAAADAVAANETGTAGGDAPSTSNGSASGGDARGFGRTLDTSLGRAAAGPADRQGVESAAPLATAAGLRDTRHREDQPAIATPAADPRGTTLDDVLPTQIIRSIRMQWQSGQGQARIHLRPEHLGEMTVAVTVDQGVVSATLHTESAEVRRWIETHSSTLRDGLAEQGLRLERLVVTDERARQEQAGADRRQHQPDRQDDDASRRRRRETGAGPVFDLPDMDSQERPPA